MGTERRGFVGHMDWEFADKRGPLDPNSPFTRWADQNRNKSIFFGNGNFATPEKQTAQPPQEKSLPKQLQPPQSSLFSPSLVRTAANIAPAFRNPAFTTPRKPFDDVEVSEAETTPGGQTDDYLAGSDTPETADRNCDRDTGLGGTMTTPARVDKNLRYGHGRTPSSARRLQMSGKGEITRRPRFFSTKDVARKRRRHASDEDVGAARDYEPGTDSESESEKRRVARISGRKHKGDEAPPGVIASLFQVLEANPNAPERLTKIGLMMLNMTVLLVSGWGVWEIVAGIKHDMDQGIMRERDTKLAYIRQCRQSFEANRCEDPLPALVQQCTAWKECMMQEADAHFRFKIFMRHFAEVLNELTRHLELKSWALVVLCALLFLAVNIWGRKAAVVVQPSPVQPPPTPLVGHDMPQPSPFAHHGMWMPGQTPRSVHGIGPSFFPKRSMIELDEATDNEEAPSDMSRRMALSASQGTPSGRRSPTRRMDTWSPTKRTPARYY